MLPRESRQPRRRRRNAGLRASRRRCRHATPRRRPDCFWMTASGATSWLSPGTSRRWPAGRRSKRPCVRRCRCTQARNFHIPDKRTPPRWISRAGNENIEALFEFETAFGPCAGVLRLRPDCQGRLRAWTLNTKLQELRGHEDEFKRRGEPDSTRDFGAENWADRLKKQRAFSETRPRRASSSAAAKPDFRLRRAFISLASTR